MRGVRTAEKNTPVCLAVQGVQATQQRGGAQVGNRAFKPAVLQHQGSVDVGLRVDG